ncbi:MAG: CBS domain-containing protein [Archaeoglobaceae archaeon]
MMELTQIQKDILHALITIYKDKRSLSVKGEEIADLINRNPGTVRNQMQALRAIGMVEGVPGPKGGYRPTSKAYELLSVTKPEESVRVPITVNDESSTLNAEEIVFPLLTHPKLCQARIKVLGSLNKLSSGDRVIVGPTPVNELMLYGKVAGRDDTTSSIVVSIDKILALPKDTVEEHMSSPIISVDSDERVPKAAQILVEREIRHVPVKENGKIIGMFNLRHVAKAVSENKLGSPIKDFLSPRAIQVEKDTRIKEALRLMRDENVRILVVADKGDPVGVITDHTILNKLAPDQVK